MDFFRTRIVYKWKRTGCVYLCAASGYRFVVDASVSCGAGCCVQITIVHHRCHLFQRRSLFFVLSQQWMICSFFLFTIFPYITFLMKRWTWLHHSFFCAHPQSQCTIDIFFTSILTTYFILAWRIFRRFFGWEKNGRAFVRLNMYTIDFHSVLTTIFH